MEKIEYLGYSNCYRLSNAEVELVVSTDFGPRILAYGPPNGTNVMGAFLDAAVDTDYGKWKPYAGHRLWAAPESIPFSYAADNDPIEFRNEGEFCIRLIQPTDAAGLEKEIWIELDPNSSKARIVHKLTNRLPKAQEIAVWALTVLSGGTAYVPLEPFRSHDDALLPTQPLILWPFTDLNDPRLNVGGGWIKVSSDPNNQEPQKIGLANKRGWAAYYKENVLFVKQFPYSEGAKYPDYGANNELYVAGDYMEIESLGPLIRLEQGQSTHHEERWRLWPNVSGAEVQKRLDALL